MVSCDDSGNYLISCGQLSSMAQRSKESDLEGALTEALSSADDPEVRYHIREALQHATAN
jgi:hypothetical protein